MSRRWRDAARKTFWHVFSLVAPSRAQKTAVARMYNQRANGSTSQLSPFINYGYAPVDAAEAPLHLDAVDEPCRLSAQLYFHVASRVDLRGRDVLEVGCGLGGGCHLIRKYLHAERVVGLDLSARNIERARQLHRDAKISFAAGDAEQLPFPSESFDVVVNVESSHHYPNLGRFLRETNRVLRKGGALLYADIFLGVVHQGVSSGQRMRQELQASLLRCQHLTDITPNIIASLDARAEPLAAALRTVAEDGALFEELANWSRLPGTKGYRQLVDRQDVYLSAVLPRD